jgi:alpha-ketoglutarate-dependent taurine dioxygenase
MSTQFANIADQVSGNYFEIKPVQPSIGAEIHGLDISKPLAPAVRDAVRAAVVKHKVVFFRDQTLDNDSQSAFASQFGTPYTHPSPNRDEKISSIHRIAAEDFKKYEGRDYNQRGDVYHSDTSWRLDPNWGAVLRAVNLPEVGGDTIWVDAHQAYEALPDEVKQRIEGLYVTHDFRRSLVPIGVDYPIVAHRIVRIHPETGQKILWVNSTLNPQILGLELADSHRLVNELIDQYKRPEFQVRFSWRPGSVAFWDNRGSLHYAVRNYGDFPRVMERVLIADAPRYAHI